MEVYKKEKSTRHHMKIDLQANGGSQDSNQDGLLLANPMACGDVSPQISSPKQDVHISLLNSISPPVLTEPHQGNNSYSVISHSRTDSFECSGNSQNGSLSRATGSSSERSSFRDKNKSRPKSPSLFRFFVKGHSVGSTNSANVSVDNSPMIGTSGRRSVKGSLVDDEEDYGGDASSNSDHEDPFSPRGINAAGDLIANRHVTESPKSPSSTSSVEHYATLPRQFKRHARNSSSGSGNYTHRDSGFSSERESVSHLREDKEIFEDARSSMSPDPVEEDCRYAGMEALDNLHNQLQILIKQNTDDTSEEEDSVTIYEQVIANLSRQLEDLSNTVDCLRQNDQSLRLSLRLAEQKTLESDTKLTHALERCHRVETRYLKLSSKHQILAKKHRELEKFQQKQSLLKTMERANAANKSSPPSVKTRSPPQRVHSQTQYDRQRPDSAPSSGRRPNTAQGFNQDQPTYRKISSMSHTETCV